MRALVLVLVLSVPVAAQTVETTLELSSLGWGLLDTPHSVETDGDLATREWLIRSLETNRFRVVAERDGRLCVGAWFAPMPTLFGSAALQRIGLLHKLVARTFSGTFTVVSLDTPACE